MTADAEAEPRAPVAPSATLTGLAPPLAEVPLPAPNAAALLRRNGTGVESADRPALRFGDRQWTHRELLAESERFAALYRARLDPRRPPHVGLLLDNTPDYVFALCGAGLAGAAVAGLNTTRRGEHLGLDISHTDLQMVITEPRHEEQLRAGTERVALPAGILVSERFADRDDPTTVGASLADALAAAWADHEASARDGTAVPEPDVDALWALLFTSGTSAAPKAVRCTQRRLLTTGNRMAMMLELGPEDVGYASMPLFHTNSLMSGLAPALVSGASLSVARRFSASRFLPDVRHYGATWFNYTGKLLTYLLATPARRTTPITPCASLSGTRDRHRSSRPLRRVLAFGSSTSSARRKEPSRWTERETVPGGPSGACDKASWSSTGRVQRRRGRNSTARAVSSTPTSASARWSTHSVRGRSRVTTATRRPCDLPPVMAGTGVGTLATSTMTGGCTSPGGPPTGCAWTVRTSRRHRSKPSSGVIRTSCWPPPTVFPLRTRGTR